ncbi:glutamyl-tRNA reductase [Arthrobacter sp. Hiyo8]|nr:glutamyl-tRNA reductase [Arthrobacter sp. Hiyo8]
MVKQLLHIPTVRARELAANGQQDEYVAALEALYGIQVEQPAASPAAECPWTTAKHLSRLKAPSFRDPALGERVDARHFGRHGPQLRCGLRVHCVRIHSLVPGERRSRVRGLGNVAVFAIHPAHACQGRDVAAQVDVAAPCSGVLKPSLTLPASSIQPAATISSRGR